MKETKKEMRDLPTNKTIRFFLDNGRYMGNVKNHPDNIEEVLSWIDSGNQIKIGQALINNRQCAINCICGVN